jgi:hypothetical protein
MRGARLSASVFRDVSMRCAAAERMAGHLRTVVVVGDHNDHPPPHSGLSGFQLFAGGEVGQQLPLMWHSTSTGIGAVAVDDDSDPRRPPGGRRHCCSEGQRRTGQRGDVEHLRPRVADLLDRIRSLVDNALGRRETADTPAMSRT